MKIVIVGGGWAGCAAAVRAAKAGAETVLLERTDMLLGTGQVGGIMRNNGRWTAAEECIAMGGGELFQLIDSCCRHKNISFPGHAHASLYDVGKTPGKTEQYLRSLGIHLRFQSRVTGVELDGSQLKAVKLQDGTRFSADAFLDTTGTAGPTQNCTKYGNGCAMCILRCPSFGGRISLTGLCGIPEMHGKKADGSIGAMSGSCKLMKGSLAPEIVEQLDRDGVVVVPLPPELCEDHLSLKACQQYALPAYSQNLVLLDTGHAKLMTPYFTLAQLHKVPGFETARYEDPYAGGKGNSMRFFAMAPRDDTLRVQGMDNLFCAGEKSGLLVGHTEAIATGTLAGWNAVQCARGLPLLTLPDTLAVGDAVHFVREQMKTEEGVRKKFTFSGSVLFAHMKERGLYTTNTVEVQERVAEAGLTNVFAGEQISHDKNRT
ncbi:FAD-dependent oxidoreductase [Caproicibacterium lactatifermentans]|uniref:FAD-dependent oxidoreductase n=1 Tax=Caproicibacterium lactatifermentans TaxID=2666138 RepID=A0ABX6PVP4_9FIRM|nr:FAD-dependent oxidoreductase [Caproicibacterium lactatifermentans]ARP51217.1 FAD-dependent oxidoreductase [Ruminococcaceae bacterium CPB6]MDD4807242.1 FAD-dependent oxidoreductase [Oscillospiraceae bacterium]QKO30376.1 FAD-dependent oxidoreductase [Caproicibacterium lactatifermentans]